MQQNCKSFIRYIIKFQEALENRGWIAKFSESIRYCCHLFVMPGCHYQFTKRFYFPPVNGEKKSEEKWGKSEKLCASINTINIRHPSFRKNWRSLKFWTAKCRVSASLVGVFAGVRQNEDSGSIKSTTDCCNWDRPGWKRNELEIELFKYEQ